MSDTILSDGTDLKVLLVNSLRKIKTGAGKDSLAFVASIAKPFYGLMLGKTASEKMGPVHKKLLTELTDSIKFVVGTCVFENEAHTFIVPTVPTGLARSLKKCLKEYTGQTYRIRVRDPDGITVADADAEGDTAAIQAEAPTAAASTSAPAQAPAPAPAPAAPAASPPPPVPDQDAVAMAKFVARFKEMQSDLQKFLAANPPQGDAIRQRAAQAGSLAKEKKFEQANQLLDEVQKGIQQAKATPTTPSTSTIPKPPGQTAFKTATPNREPGGTARSIRLSTYLNGRANLRTARDNAAKELQRLQQSILEKSKDEPFYQEVETKSRKLLEYLASIDDTVIDKLDEAGKCNDPERQTELNAQLVKLIQQKLEGLRNHPMASFVEKNPFGKFIVRQPLEVTLSALAQQLST